MACASCGKRAKARKALAAKTSTAPVAKTSSNTVAKATVTPVSRWEITVDWTTYKGVKSQLKAPVNVVAMNMELRKQARKELKRSRRKFWNSVKLVKKLDDKAVK